MPKGKFKMEGSTSQEPANRDKGGVLEVKRKRKFNFTEEENQILIYEVTKQEKNLFVTSSLPLSRKYALWQGIVDKINTVAPARRTIVECKKRWHDYKRRTKEKLARNLQAALTTGGGLDFQELNPMEEDLVARVEAIYTADLEALPTAQEEEQRSPDLQSVSDVSPELDSYLPSMVDETFQQIRRTIKSSPPVLARDEDVAVSPSDLTQTDSHPPPEHCGQQYQEDFEVSFERRVFGVQQQMLEEVKSGMETLAGTLEGVRMCLSPNKGITEAIRDTHSWLHGIDDSLADIAGVMIAKSKQPQSCSSCSSDVVEQLGVINSSIHSFHHGVESKLDSFINTMSALNSNVVAVLENQQSLARDFNATFKALTNVLSTLHPTSSSSADSALVAGRSMSAPQLQPTPLPEEHAESSEDEEVVFPTLRGRFLR